LVNSNGIFKRRKVMPVTAKITSKGQVTIPRKIRDVLKSSTIEFEVIKGGVLIRPVSSVGGSLKSYAKGLRPLGEIRDKVWEEVAHVKARG
jgi:AbrB family looped-hinge helix DNA binding protein